MAFWSDLVAVKAASAAPYIDVITSGLAGGPFRDPDPTMYANQAELMQRLSWVYSAVQRTSESLASLAEFEVFQLAEIPSESDVPGKKRKRKPLAPPREAEDTETPDAPRQNPPYVPDKRKPAATRLQLDNHPAQLLLYHPNDYQFDSRFEFFEAISAYLRLNGNAYIWMNAPADNKPPDELWVLRPDRMAVVPDRNKFIRAYVYEVNGRPMTFEPSEIVHLKTFHPLNDWYGLSAIESIALASELDFKQQEYARNFFDRDNAKVPGALAFSEWIDDVKWARMKRDIVREHGGTKRRLMLLRGAGKGGVEYLQMGLTQQEMQYLQSRQFTKEEIYQALAPGLLQILDKNATEANALAGEKTFREYCLYPMLQRIAEKLTARMLPRYGERLLGEFKDIRHRDRAMERQEQDTYAMSHTLDEIRTEYYDDEPIGDERGNRLLREITPPPPAPPEGMGAEGAAAMNPLAALTPSIEQ